MFIVTVKYPKNPDHNPNAKQTGPCPASGKPCDDVTGEHHSFIFQTLTGRAQPPMEWVRTALKAEGMHVTRIEEV